jgi:RNase P subunit RPR2
MKNKYIVDLTERMAAFCDKCETVRNLDVKQNKDGSLTPVCEKCGYHNPIWK